MQQGARISPHRFRVAALGVHGGVHRLCKKLTLAQRSVVMQVKRGAVTPALAAELRQQLGEMNWRFVTGESNALVLEDAA